MGPWETAKEPVHATARDVPVLPFTLARVGPWVPACPWVGPPRGTPCFLKMVMEANFLTPSRAHGGTWGSPLMMQGHPLEFHILQNKAGCF